MDDSRIIQDLRIQVIDSDNCHLELVRDSLSAEFPIKALMPTKSLRQLTDIIIESEASDRSLVFAKACLKHNQSQNNQQNLVSMRAILTTITIFNSLNSLNFASLEQQRDHLDDLMLLSELMPIGPFLNAPDSPRTNIIDANIYLAKFIWSAQRPYYDLINNIRSTRGSNALARARSSANHYLARINTSTGMESNYYKLFNLSKRLFGIEREEEL